MSWPAGPYLSHGAAGLDSQDPEAWRPDSVVLAEDPPAFELARRLGEADLEALRPGELIQFSVAAGQLAAWADGLRASAEARLAVLLGAR